MKGPKTSLMLIFGIASYLIFLILQTPAAFIVEKLKPLPNQIQIYNAEGTLLSGRTALVSRDQWRFEEVQWVLRPWKLLIGHLEYQVSFKNTDETKAQTDVGVTLLRHLYLAHTQMKIPLKYLDPLLRSMMIKVDGWINGEFQYLAWSTDGPDVQGQITLGNITLPNKTSIQLGDFVVALESVEEDLPQEVDQKDVKKKNGQGNPLKRIVKGTITDLNAAVEVRGQLRLNSLGNWQLTGAITPRSTTPAQIRQGLSLFGQPDQSGRYLLSFKGHLSI